MGNTRKKTNSLKKNRKKIKMKFTNIAKKYFSNTEIIDHVQQMHVSRHLLLKIDNPVVSMFT